MTPNFVSSSVYCVICKLDILYCMYNSCQLKLVIRLAVILKITKS